MRPITFSAQRQAPRLVLDLRLQLLAQAVRRQRATRVARMHAGLLDVLHDAADVDVLAVAERVDVDFDRQVEEAIEQHGAVVRDLHGVRHVRAQVVLREDDFHRATAEHVARAHDERKADFGREPDRFVLGARRAVRRLPQLQPLDELLEALAVFGDVDRIGARADDRHARVAERLGKLERRLATVLHDHAERLFDVHDFHDVFERERLEIQPVRRVVVGRDGFRVAVDHDGLEPVLAQRERRVHAAVVELDALADAVRTAAEDHDLAVVRGRRLALFLVGRVHVRGRRREFGGARVDALEDRPHAETVAALAHCAFSGTPSSFARRLSAKPLRFNARSARRVERREAACSTTALLFADQVLDLREEPRVDARRAVDLLELDMPARKASAT